MNLIYTETYEVKTKSPLILFPRETAWYICSLVYLIDKFKKKKIMHVCIHTLFFTKTTIIIYTLNINL